MLERASSSAEYTAHQFLRRLEIPTRSRRALDPGFWRHGGDQLDVPVWWPVYLSNVRKKAQAYSVFPDIAITRSLLPSKARPDFKDGTSHISRLSRRRQTTLGSNKTRSFARSAAQTQQLPTSIIELGRPLEGPDYVHDYTANKVGSSRKAGKISLRSHTATLSSPYPHSLRSPVVASHTTDERNDADVIDLSTSESTKEISKPDYARAWSLFAESEWTIESASRLLQFLAESDDRIDLRHALSALDFLPGAQRTREDYETAVQVAIKLHDYRRATILIQEAASKDMGDNLFFKFMAHCVNNTLWNTLAIFWDTIRSSHEDWKSILRRAKFDRRSPNFAGRFAYHFDGVSDLPGKIVILAERLARSDAVLAAQKVSLTEICKRLAYVAVESQKIMGIITGEGATAIFNVQRKLGFDSKLHLAAIRTIHDMQDRGTRSELALHVYRNLRLICPNVIVPYWTYGSLLAICSDGRQRPDIYSFLLEEFRRMHGRPDDFAFRVAMSACASQAESITLFKIFEDFCRVSGPKTLYDLNPLVHVYAVVGDVENACLQFNRLQPEFGFLPDVVSWTSLVLAHARSRDGATAFNVFEDMKKAKVQPNAFTWAILMSIASKRGDTIRVQELLEEAKEDKTPASNHMTGALVESLLINDEFQKAEDLVLQRTRLNTSESPIRLWNSLFRYCAFKADESTLLRLKELIALFNVKADGMTYAAFMTSLVVHGKTKDAAKLLRKLLFSRSLKPTEFHYSILIHGFVKEGNRDMATVLYHEMQDRFPRLSPSARLAMLHLQMQRDVDSTKLQPKSRIQRSPGQGQAAVIQDAWHALDHLATSLLQQSSTDISSSAPNPGFGRLHPREGLESIYLQTLIDFLQKKGAHETSEQLLKVGATMLPSTGTASRVATKDLYLRMRSAMQKQEWPVVEEIWNQIFSKEIDQGSQLEKYESQKPENDIDKLGELHELSSALPALKGISIPSTDAQSFKSMIPVGAPDAPDALFSKNAAGANTSSVLPAQRFLLSRPLSSYIQCLDHQHRHDTIIDVAQRIVDRGFALSSMNWNRYVQALSKSSHWKHRLAAFVAFENNLLPNMPPWRLLRRGKWTPLGARSVDAIKDRKKLDKLDPSIPRPTYFTMIHLSTALMRAHQSASAGNREELDSLLREAPYTTAKVQRTPRIRDRIQGLLLRGRKIIGDPLRRPRASPSSVDRSGITGSKSPFDCIPLDVTDEIRDEIAPGDDIRTLLGKERRQQPDDVVDPVTASLQQRFHRHLTRVAHGDDKIDRRALFLQSSDYDTTGKESNTMDHPKHYAKLQHLVDLAEQTNGKIMRSAIFLQAQGRMENDRERKRRILKDTVDKLDMMEQIRKDAATRVFVSDEYRGEPSLSPYSSYSSSLTSTSTSPKAKALAEVLLNGGEKSLLQDDVPAKPKEFESTFQPFTFRKREDPPQTISMQKVASRDTYPAVDTRTLTRKIPPPYVPRDKNTPVKYTTSKQEQSWTRNKDKRRTELKERQSLVRWLNSTQSQRAEKNEKLEVARAAIRAREWQEQKKKDDGRVARLVESRGARR